MEIKNPTKQDSLTNQDKQPIVYVMPPQEIQELVENNEPPSQKVFPKIKLKRLKTQQILLRLCLNMSCSRKPGATTAAFAPSTLKKPLPLPSVLKNKFSTVSGATRAVMSSVFS